MKEERFVIVFLLGILLGLLIASIIIIPLANEKIDHAKTEGFIEAYCEMKKLGFLKENEPYISTSRRSIIEFDICPISENTTLLSGGKT